MRPDDEAWFETLAGRRTEGSDVDDEARQLRAALRRTPVQLPARLSEQEIDALVQRGRRRTLSRWRAWSCRICAQRWRRAWPLAAGGALVSVLIASVAPWPDAPEPPVLRGAPSGVQSMAVVGAAAQRDGLADELAALGLRVRRYERLGRHGLDVEAGTAWPEAAARLLASRGLTLPPAGEPLQIEFVERAP